MKFFCTIFTFIFLCITNCFSQDSSVFHLNTIPPEGILLDKNWKFHAADNPEWSNPAYDDSQWKNLSPDIDVHHLLKQNKDAGVGWFRLKFKVDSSLQDSSAALVISQVVASEIYLNGKLLYRFGNVSSDYNKEKTYTINGQPFIIHLARQDIQELAVHYSFNPKKFIVLFNTNPCIGLTLKSSNQSLSDFASATALGLGLTIAIVAMYLTLCLFCLYFFISFRKERAYLFVAINSLGQTISLLLYSLLFSSIKSITTASFIFILSNTISSICLIFLLSGFNLFFNFSKTRYYKFFLVYVLLAIPISFVGYTSARIQMASFGAIITLAFIPLSIKAIFRKRPGAWIVLIGISISFLCGVGNVYSVVTEEFIQAGYYAAIMFITVPLLSTFFIAGEFARTGLALQGRVKEVEELSEEKHRILSEQNIMLEKQVEQRTSALNKSLQELKSTQAQLIQSEKMASLGELTAGIAHEIQNPLNFVNNFSDVNKELLFEMNTEIEKGNYDEVKAIAKDVVDNHEKINHHGKRADAIVKNMLQHSRSSSGKKEPTDLNALADEYLRLAYNNLRAKDKSFKATTKTEFDNGIGKINVNPQEFGRVILNLINNAFYAVSEKQKQNLNGFEPTVTVSTKKQNDKVEIKVTDNGNGIPQKVLDKIFQPFFTTKPTGQGTGLGLSLSYDIVKAHGGEIKVATKENEGTEFIIQLAV
jgi:signal transduction histidine kinase